MKPDYRKYPYNWIKNCLDLAPGPMLLWLILNNYQGNNKTSWPQVYSLAADLNVNQSTITQWTNELVDKGYLIKTKAKMRHGRNRNTVQNHYRVSHPTLERSWKSQEPELGNTNDQTWKSQEPTTVGTSSKNKTSVSSQISTPLGPWEDPEV